MSDKLTIGGQAVIEGVMMRTIAGYSVAVRRPDQSIAIKTERTTKGKAPKWRKWPIIRGAIGLVDSMYLGVKCLMYSSGEALGEEEELSDGALWLSVALGIGGSVVLFMILPKLITGLIKANITNTLALNLVEGAMRILIFVSYVAIIGRMPDVQRVFKYHGAEHKTINCYEHDCPLTVEEAQKFTTVHVRCGTAFMLLVMVIAVFIFSLFGWQNVWQRILTRITLLPIIAGLSYEAVQAAGKHQDKLIWKIILAPGLWMQRLTTSEPDDDQVEIAIAAFNAALQQEQQTVNIDVTGVNCNA